MLNSRDLYTYSDVANIMATNTTQSGSKQSGSSASTGTQIGVTMISLEIRRYRDLKNLTTTPLAYQILYTQRIVIPNSSAYQPGGQSSNSFSSYPAILQNTINIESPPSSEEFHIVSYFPKTLNSAVSTSSNDSSNSQASATLTHTSGSSTSQSNSFGASGSLGLLGDMMTGGISSEFDTTTGHQHFESKSNINEMSNGSQHSSGDSMTIKDWSCNSYLDVNGQTLSWVWGQEYPWNVIKYAYDKGSQNITLPNFVASLLQDPVTGQALPPSDLSRFGLDFTMKASWIVKPPKGETKLVVNNTINYCTASHNTNGNTKPNNASSNITATISPELTAANKITIIDMCSYGLDPLTGKKSSAIVGFIPKRFLIKPAPVTVNGSKITPPIPFKIISASNNLVINDTTTYLNTPWTTADKGAGFSPSETSLTAAFTQNCTKLEMTVKFKIIDTTDNYVLYMKHWKAGGANTAGVKLTISINPPTTPNTNPPTTPNTNPPTTPIVKYVDAMEAEGGDNNLLSVSLRNLDYGSIDFHDFLQLGQNTLSITIQPIDNDYQGCSYKIRAISIERL